MNTSITKFGFKKLMILLAPVLVTALLAITLRTSADDVCGPSNPIIPENILCW